MLPSLDSPAQERFKPSRSRSSLSLSSSQKKILLTKFTGQQAPERRCLTARGRSSGSFSSDYLTSSSSRESRRSSDSLSRPRYEEDKENMNENVTVEDNSGPSKRLFSGGPLLPFVNRTFTDARRNTTEDSDLEDFADTVDSDDDLPLCTEVADDSMQIETPVKGMAGMMLSPMPVSPYCSKVGQQSPYARTARCSSSFEKKLQERETEKFNQTLAKCVEATGIPDSDYVPYLEVLPNTSSRLNCISAETVAALVNNAYSHHFNEVVIIDCRYEYEFVGGHIKGAINCPTPESIDELFVNFKPSDRTCYIFHCEFSSHRGPKGYSRVRSADRTKNLNRYPALHFPEMYLLEGGYKVFFEKFQNLCHPPAYVPMREEEFRDALRTSQCAIKRKPGNPLEKSRRFLSKSCSNIFEGMSLNAADDDLFNSPNNEEEEEDEEPRRRFLSTQ
eukprot:TRINITY_DN16893_c0_g1_i1.p1 TRINITY_DN16893_c0_g1~~TRINITY_DN16893_c0_g1_i1.p1  ORF type:complete len:447 (-),score=92.89 TRINITY_DN16893_c0_g1_i1:95-1435(-)